MKKLNLLLGLFFIYGIANATIYRVNNFEGIDADYTNFTTAHLNASDGDTIYVEGSPNSYGDISISKNLIIFGPGYFLTENDSTQQNKNTAEFGDITINSNSEGTQIEGLVINDIYLKCGEIEIKKNYIDYIEIYNTNNLTDIVIAQNYFNPNSSISGRNDGSDVSIIITNNKFGYGNQYNRTLDLNEHYTGTISQNIFDGSEIFNVYGFDFINNIMNGGYLLLNNNNFFNNISSSSQFPSGNGNLQDINMDYVFVGETGNSTDGQYQLNDTSPAKGAGINGEDCGMFGGDAPYVLSGLPNLPAIYEMQVPATATTGNGITITVKAKAH